MMTDSEMNRRARIAAEAVCAWASGDHQFGLRLARSLDYRADADTLCAFLAAGEELLDRAEPRPAT